MIGRAFKRKKQVEAVIETKSFDDFELRLGDLMRGERATLGKSLLDVQRELKIKAAYIAAIENCDPSVFDTPGFIAGYVRSYARYLRMDPDKAFEIFCQESGFSPTQPSFTTARSTKREERVSGGQSGPSRDIFTGSLTPFIPSAERMFSGIEPRAIGSLLVLGVLIGGLGYGAWSVVQEVQRVQFAPVEQSPIVLAEVDPLAGGGAAQVLSAEASSIAPPSPEALDRLYRPQALELPVLIARDGPIAGLDPDSIGTLASNSRENLFVGPMLPKGGISQVAAPVVETQLAQSVEGLEVQGPMVQVTTGPVAEVQLVAVRPAWVRVNAADGTVLYEGILKAGETYPVPAMEAAPKVRVGESGALYLAVNGVPHGPVGPSGVVTKDISLAAVAISERFAVADLTKDSDLADVVRVAQLVVPQQ